MNEYIELELEKFDKEFNNIRYDSVGWTGDEIPVYYIKSFLRSSFSRIYDKAIEDCIKALPNDKKSLYLIFDPEIEINKEIR